MSAYYLEHANVDHIKKHFDFFEAEAHSLLDLGLAIPAYVFFYFSYYIMHDNLWCFLHIFSINIFLYNVLGMISF